MAKEVYFGDIHYLLIISCNFSSHRPTTQLHLLFDSNSIWNVQFTFESSLPLVCHKLPITKLDMSWILPSRFVLVTAKMKGQPDYWFIYRGGLHNISLELILVIVPI